MLRRRNVLFWLPWLWALAVFASPGRAAAQEQQIGPLLVRALPTLPALRSQHGYAEHRFEVTNTSAEPHEVELVLPHSDYLGPGDFLSRVSRSLVVAPGTTALVSLPRPQIPIVGDNLAVVIDGRRQGEPLLMSIEQQPFWRADLGELKTILVSSRLAADDFEVLGERLGEDYALLPTTVPVSAWSGHWLAFTGYDAIVMTVAEHREAPPAVLEALERWTHLGGTLVLLQAEATAGPTFAGFGEQWRVDAESLFLMDDQEVTERLLESVENSHQPWKLLGNLLQTHETFPIVRQLQVPVRGLFLLMVGFALVVGPMNLIWVRRRGRRLWILWTVPLLSLVAAAGVLGFALFAEGLVRRERIEVLTLLDEGTGEAVTVGRAAFYSTLTPGDGLHFDLDTEVNPVRDEGRGPVSSISRQMSWGQDQHLSRGWVQARLPVQMQVRRFERRRERLALRREGDGSLSVVNGLGAPIEDLWLADGQGRVFRSPVFRGPLDAAHVAVEAGATLALELVPEAVAADEGGALRGLYTSRWVDFESRLGEEPWKSLRPGSYVAVFAEGHAPFFERPLAEADESSRRGMVYGLLAEVP